MNQTCRPSRCMHSLDSWSSKSLRWLNAIVHGWLYFENLVWLCLFTISTNEIINVVKGEWPWRSGMGIYNFTVSALQYVPPSLAFRPTSHRHGHVHWDIFGNTLPSKFFRLFRSFLVRWPMPFRHPVFHFIRWKLFTMLFCFICLLSRFT